jgi:acyl-homoserine lactone acylase PvdQ
VNHFLSTSHYNNAKTALRGIAIDLELLMLGYWSRADIPPWKPQDTVAISILLSLQLSFKDNIDLEFNRFWLLIHHGHSPDWIDDLYVPENNFTTVSQVRPDLLDVNKPERDTAERKEESKYMLELQQRLRVHHFNKHATGTSWWSLNRLRQAIFGDYFTMLTRDMHSIRASSMYVLSGNMTQNQAPLLSTELALPKSVAPNLWYYNKLINTNETDSWSSHGASIPGIPYILSGTNGYTSWGINPSYADANDLFLVEGVEITKIPINVRDEDPKYIQYGYVPQVGYVVDDVLGYDGEKCLVLRTNLLNENNTM